MRDADNSGQEISVEASENKLGSVLGFIEERLEEAGCSFKTQMQIAVAAEEIFINIAKYAYLEGKGRAQIRFSTENDPKRAVITFLDNGMPYDPLAREDPDVTLPADERPVGGLGIYMVKKTMDDVIYKYKDGQNILTIVKNL